MSDAAAATMLERRGAIAIVTLSRPERMNAMGDEVWRGIDAAVVDCEQRRPRALVVAGAGGNFSVGFDLNPDNPLLAEIERSMRERDPGPARQMLRRINMILHRLGRLRCLTIVAFEGYACGGGLELALAYDLRVVSRALVETDALRELTRTRYARVMEGLARQLRAPLHHDPLAGTGETAAQ